MTSGSADVRRTVLELYAGAGGLALGLERAGFDHNALIEWDEDACKTLRTNRPSWDVADLDIRLVDAAGFVSPDLIAAGLPRPSLVDGALPRKVDSFSELKETLRFIKQLQPKSILLENVSALAAPRYTALRRDLDAQLFALGYDVAWTVLQAYEFGLPQVRPRYVLVALRQGAYGTFEWPLPGPRRMTAGEALGGMMAERGWKGAIHWARAADDVAPTIVGGSRNRGGADLGPTRSRLAWLALGVDGRSIADTAPGPDDPFTLTPKLTNRMVSLLQGFDESWTFFGKKTSVYRQLASAFPPPLAKEVGVAIMRALL